jgi:hypothetical protein
MNYVATPVPMLTEHVAKAQHVARKQAAGHPIAILLIVAGTTW